MEWWQILAVCVALLLCVTPVLAAPRGPDCTAVTMASDLDAMPTGAWLAVVGIAVAFGALMMWLWSQDRAAHHEEMLKRHKERGERVRQLLEEVER